MFIELLIIVGIVIFVLDRVTKTRDHGAVTTPKQSQPKPAAPQALGAEPENNASARPARRLTIAGTDGFPLHRAGFFAGFGVSPKLLCDARVYRGGGTFSELPLEVKAAVEMLYAEGGAMGAEVMRFLHHGRRLDADEALYFALTREVPKSDSYAMYAFVDRAH